jgi:hypothetical protein
MIDEDYGAVNDAARQGVEARLLARAAGKTVAQLREAARRAVLRADAAAAANRLARAIRERGVRMHPGRDGMATLATVLTQPVAAACRAALAAYARECATPGDTRTLDQRMADALTDLILRPGTNPPVQVGLTLVAGVDTLRGGDEPGEIDGHPVPAALIRELAHSLGLLPRPDTTHATTEPQEPDAEAAAGAGLAGLLNLRSVTGTALTHLPRLAIIEEISGQLLALTDAAGLRHAATGGHGLGPPPDTDGYTPSDPLGRFVRARDRRCRFPGCRAAAIRCDAHHCTRWPDGPTSETNLCCLCRHHHRLVHQAPGWTTTRLPDGALQWTSPSGHTITTHPPRYGTDDDLPPPTPPPPPPPAPADDDPPPF